MRTSSLVSRLSALVFAIGLGAAILGNSSVASAEPSDAGSSSNSSSSSESEPSHTSSPGAEPGDDSAQPDEDNTETAETDDPLGTDDEEASDEGTNEDEQASDSDSATTESEQADEDLKGDPAQRAGRGSLNNHADTDRTQTPEPAEPAEPAGDEQHATKPAEPVVDTVLDTASVTTATHQPTVEVTTAAMPVAQPVLDAPELGDVDEPLPFNGVVASVLQLFGWTPLLQQNPVAPETESPASWALLAWLRRQVQETFFNRTPTAESQQLLYSPTDGSVLGRINATDAEGDELMWRLVEGPRHGTVTLGVDGSYRYTPDPDFVAFGGVDAFVVTVRDAGLHMHLFNGTGKTVVAVPVTVTNTAVASVGLTLGFDVINLSSHPLKFDKYSNTYDRPESGPTLDQVFKPGEVAHFELVRPFLESRVDAHFVATDGSGVSFWVGMDSQSLFGIGQVTCSNSGRSACTPSRWSPGTVVGLMDPPGTVIRLGPNSPGAQRDVLNGLCSYSVQSTCDFKPDRQENVWTSFRQISSTLTNPTPVNQTISKAYSHAVSQSDSVSVAAKIGFKLTDIVNFEITTTYGHTWTDTQTYTETVTLTVPPFYQGWIDFRDRVYRVSGTFTLTMGDTTWIVEDVYFDTPIEGAQNGEFKPHVEPLLTEGESAEVA
ncbi:Ig-like domain-containing protein [Mycolicibacterium sp. CR10]|uniref:Ig-like domain-containing protein n=1 Tax=Mycolicibacterium sp. CR10 TaxID=2562314 RepID=UPI0010BF704A|nr:Ig-like domain-containing protein [Mycolicibacterium sp. CR10]